jgi:hypothetical protein
MMLEEIHKQAANGKEDAAMFLHLWVAYCHIIDDFIDEKKRDPEEFIAMLIHANLLYSVPFYQKNAERLRGVVIQVTNAYADSVKWENSGLEEGWYDWRSVWADTLRFSGSEMVIAVATITGGWELARKLSPLLREVNWMEQHEPKPGVDLAAPGEDRTVRIETEEKILPTDCKQWVKRRCPCCGFLCHTETCPRCKSFRPTEIIQ